MNDSTLDMILTPAINVASKHQVHFNTVSPDWSIVKFAVILCVIICAAIFAILLFDDKK